MTDSPAAEAPKPVLQQVAFANLFASMINYTAPANEALDAAIKANVKDGDHETAVRETSHYDVIVEWCRQNPALAGLIVICAVYLGNGKFLAQGVQEGGAAEQER